MPIAPEPMTSKRLRHLVGVHRLEIGPDQLLVGLEARQHARPRAGRDDDVLGLVGARAERAFGAGVLRAFTVTLPGASIVASPQITATLFFFIRKVTPVFMRPATPRERLITAAGSKLTLSADKPVVLGVLHVVVDLRRAQQRLGRDAAPVRADAAEIVAFHNRGLEPELGRADGRHVAARARADDDDVERCLPLAVSVY